MYMIQYGPLRLSRCRLTLRSTLFHPCWRDIGEMDGNSSLAIPRSSWCLHPHRLLHGSVDRRFWSPPQSSRIPHWSCSCHLRQGEVAAPYTLEPSHCQSCTAVRSRSLPLGSVRNGYWESDVVKTVWGDLTKWPAKANKGIFGMGQKEERSCICNDKRHLKCAMSIARMWMYNGTIVQYRKVMMVWFVRDMYLDYCQFWNYVDPFWTLQYLVLLRRL